MVNFTVHDEKLFRDLPGEDIVRKGLSDLLEGLETVSSLLVASGLPRLKWNGLELSGVQIPSQPEQKLYTRLREDYPENAYAKYNSLMRELSSFSRALESRLTRMAKERANVS